MKFLIGLIFGLIIGAAAVWWYEGQNRHQSPGQALKAQVENTTTSARDAINQKLAQLHLRPDDIKDEISRTGQVIRERASDIGSKVADAANDTRITTTIKGRFVADPDLSAVSISVNTTGGVVTLAGTVDSVDDVSKAMMIAMDTDGVHRVVSSLQVKPKA